MGPNEQTDENQRNHKNQVSDLQLCGRSPSCQLLEEVGFTSLPSLLSLGFLPPIASHVEQKLQRKKRRRTETFSYLQPLTSLCGCDSLRCSDHCFDAAYEFQWNNLEPSVTLKLDVMVRRSGPTDQHQAPPAARACVCVSKRPPGTSSAPGSRTPGANPRTGSHQVLQAPALKNTLCRACCCSAGGACAAELVSSSCSDPRLPCGAHSQTSRMQRHTF